MSFLDPPSLPRSQADTLYTPKDSVNPNTSGGLDYIATIKDSLNNAALGIKADGTVEMSKGAFLQFVRVFNATVGREADNLSGDLFAIADNQGRSPFIIRSDGKVTLKLASDSDMGALLPPRSYYLNEHYLRWSRMLLRKLSLGDASTQFDIALIGDSYTHNRTRWSGPFWQTLKTTYGDAGVGWVGFSNPSNIALQNGSVRSDTTLTVTGTWTPTYTGTRGPDLGEMLSTTAGDTINIVFPSGQTSAKLYYIGSANGQAQYRWNGGAWTTIALTSGSGTLQIATLAGIATGSTSLDIQVVSGSVILCGVDIRNSGNGIRVHKLAATGSAAYQWSVVNTASWNVGLQALAPQLVVIMHGTNDQTGGASVATFATRIQTIITNVRSALGSTATDILLVMPSENQRTTNAVSMASYAEAVRTLALANNCAYLDTQYLFGENAADYAYGSARPWYASDLIHPDPNTGGRVIADGVLRVLTTR